MTGGKQTARDELVIFVGELLSEPSTDPERPGKASFSRTATALVLLASLVWLTRIVWTTNALPEALSLGALAAFLGALYGLNKFNSAK